MPSQPPPQPAAPPPPPVPQIQVSDEQILSLRGMFEGALEQKIPVDALVATLVEQNSAVVIRSIAASITAERVVTAIISSPGGARSPLVRREGQQYLRQVLAAAALV